jgi:putative SOS response-associated peptidase YedK
VIRSDGDERELLLMRWGLIPRWAKDEKIGYKMINARAETVPEKPSFRDAYASRRLIIPVSGFYEWKRSGSHKQPFAIRHPDRSPLAFAGIWESWHDLETFAIVTTEANEAMQAIHDRMPLILSTEQFDAWLDPDNPDPSDVLTSVPDEELELVPVSDYVNNARHEGPQCLEPL